MDRRQYYAKGFKIDRGLIAKTFEIAHRNDEKVDSFLLTIVEGLNREAYKCITTAYDHEARTDEPYLCNIIAIETGTDKEALEALDLGPLDKTIEKRVLMYLLDHGCGSFGDKTCALSTSPCHILISSYHIDTGVHGSLAFSFIALPLPFLISFSNFLVLSCDYLRIITS
jgi:hypothetical protein